MERHFVFAADDARLPRGSRAVTRANAIDDEGNLHRAGVHVVVKDLLADGRYAVETVAGAALVVDRSILALEKPDLLAPLALRQHDHERLREHVVLAVVVGSQAWGLADEASDEDVRGCFVLPFEEHASIYEMPDEIHDGETAFWEIEKLCRQGLRADPNTLETLWSPLVRIEQGIGVRLRRERGLFSSRRVVDSFGRYAQSQLHKLERSATRRENLALLLDAIAAGRAPDEKTAKKLLPKEEDVHALVRSLFDRGLVTASSYAALVEAVGSVGATRLLPEEVRPKNAYNLVRLLHSCATWIRTGAPLITVAAGPLRDELLAIKKSQISLSETLKRAATAAALVDELAKGPSPLPEEPDWHGADALLKEARRSAARTVFATASSPPSSSIPADAFSCAFAPTPLPLDVDLPALREFLAQKQQKLPGPFLVVGLTGAHAYGFPSPDSDLDLKAVHVAPAAALLGLSPKTDPLELVEVFRGREMDLSSHELLQAAQLLLKGNGNLLERLLGPCVVLRSPLGEDLCAHAKAVLSRRCVHHYRGFFERMLVEAGKAPTAKKQLYAYRVALTGAHLLATGELVTDVRTLAPRYGFDVSALIELKKKAEKVASTNDETFTADSARLRQLLDEKLATSVLPETPAEDAVRALDSWIVEVRLASPLQGPLQGPTGSGAPSQPPPPSASA